MYTPIRHIPSIFWKRRPIQLTFFVTDRCNAKCPFCFYRQNKDYRPKYGNELSVDEIRQIARRCGKLLWLAFSGGEIFLRRDLVEISQIFYEFTKPVFMLYPTNGLMPQTIKKNTEAILRLCENSTITVKLSIDGLFDDHDELRNTPGCFNKTIKTYHLLSQLVDRYPNFELGVNTVFCSKNQDNMAGIIEFVRKLEYVTTHTISLIRGDLIHADYKNVDYDKYAKATALLDNRLRHNSSQRYHFKGNKIKAAQDIIQRKLIHQTALSQSRLIPCYAGKANIVMSERGDIYPCEILNYSFGNVRDFDYDLKKVRNSPEAHAFSSNVNKGKCFCTHECHFMTNILLNPALYPQLAKEYLQINNVNSAVP